MSYVTVPIFYGEHRRLYRETQLAYIVSDRDNSTNHLIYVVEQDLDLTIMHTSADEADSLSITKPSDSKSRIESLHLANQIWKLFFDVASSRGGSGAGVVLISPTY